MRIPMFVVQGVITLITNLLLLKAFNYFWPSESVTHDLLTYSGMLLANILFVVLELREKLVEDSDEE